MHEFYTVEPPGFTVAGNFIGAPRVFQLGTRFGFRPNAEIIDAIRAARESR